MSFKILLKQSFRSLSKKFRLYLSLIIFLIVAFSMIAGIGTYFTTWRSDIENILYTGKAYNFEIPKFKFTNSQDKNNENVLFRFSDQGQKQFTNYLELKSNASQDLTDSFIKDLGEASGNISLLDSNKYSSIIDFDDWTKKSRYFGNNLVFMYLDKVLKNNDSHYKTNAKVQTGTYDDIDGVYSEDRSITLKIRPLPETTVEQSLFEDNDLNKLTDYKSKTITGEQKEELSKKGLMPFYVNPKFLRDNHKKVGSEISVVVNNIEHKGYIAGLKANKYHLFFSNNEEGLYVDLDDFAKMTNNSFIDSESLIGYYEIKNSKNAFVNSDEYKIAYRNLKGLLLSNGNDPNDAIFTRTKGNVNQNILRKLDDTNSKVSFFHEPMNLYMGFMAIMIIVLCILVIIVSYFIIDESIRSEKKTLWFLKAMGETTLKISLLNSMSVIVPLFLALALSIPGTMLVMEFLTIAVTTDYAFTIPWYALTPMFAIMIVAFFFGILLVFLFINGLLIHGKALSIQSGDKLSRFQMGLAKVTNPMVKNANGKFRVGFAFIKQNLIKNLVSFVIFAILFTVTLFGVQFNRSIHNQENAYQEWMDPYHSISTLSPKKMITDDGKYTTYETLTKDKYDQSITSDVENDGTPYVNKNNKIPDNPHVPVPDDLEREKYEKIVDKYARPAFSDYDLLKYFAVNWLDALDIQDHLKDNSFINNNKDKTILIDSAKHEILSMPNNPEYYEQVSTRLALMFMKIPDVISNPSDPNKSDYPDYYEATYIWHEIRTGKKPEISDKLKKALEADWGIDYDKYIPLHNNTDLKDLMDIKNLNITTTNSNNLYNVSVSQWLLRQFKNISLWAVNDGYLASGMKLEEQLPDKTKQVINNVIDTQKNKLPDAVKPAFNTIASVLQAQHEIFGVKYPTFSINFGNIIQPEKNTKSSIAIQASFKGTKLLGYGLDPDEQPFNDPVNQLLMSSTLTEHKSGEDGLTYKTIDTVFSENAKNQKRWKIGDIVPVDLAQTGVKSSDTLKPLGLRIVGFKSNDSVLTEGFFNYKALNEYIKEATGIDTSEHSLINTFYTTEKVPYFLQHITVPHMNMNGNSIDDYIYKLDTFTSDHKTTDQISKVFADTVDSYSKLMTKIIILLIVLCFALSSIIITLIMFENKKTILLFKAMGYRKRDVIWYIISGYLIAALAALVFGFGVSAAATIGLAPMFAEKIFLQLIFTPFWLWFVIGIFETLCFMALVVVSIITYTRVLKPRDAFATL